MSPTNPLTNLRTAAAKQLTALSVDIQGFYAALSSVGAALRGIRVVVRDRDGMDFAHGNYLPRRANDAPASSWTGSVMGVAKYLLGRPDAGTDFAGLLGPFDGTDEIELQIDGNVWINARTGEITQSPGFPPVALKPPTE